MRLLFAAIAVVVGLRDAKAHVSEGMTSEVHMGSDLISITTMVDIPYIFVLVPESTILHDGKLTEAEAEAMTPRLGDELTSRLIFTNNGMRLCPTSIRFAGIEPDPVTSEPHSLKFTAEYLPTTGSLFQKVFFDPNVFFRTADGMRISIPAEKIDFFMHSVTLVDCGLVHLIPARGQTTFNTDISPSCKLRGKPLVIPANPRSRPLDTAPVPETGP